MDDGSGALAEVTCARASALEAAPAAFRPGQTVHLGPPAWMGRSRSGSDVNMRGVQVGAFVRAEGGISTFRGDMQVSLETIRILTDTTAEVEFWEELDMTWRILKEPWVLDEVEIAQLREEADGSRKAAKEKAEREEGRKAREERRVKRHEERKRREEMLEREADERDLPISTRDITNSEHLQIHKPGQSMSTGNGYAPNKTTNSSSVTHQSSGPDKEALTGRISTTSALNKQKTMASITSMKQQRHAEPKAKSIAPRNHSDDLDDGKAAPPERAHITQSSREEDPSAASPSRRGYPLEGTPESLSRRADCKVIQPTTELSTLDLEADGTGDTEADARWRAALVHIAWQSCGCRSRSSCRHASGQDLLRSTDANRFNARGLAETGPATNVCESEEAADEEAAACRRAAAVSAAWMD